MNRVEKYRKAVHFLECLSNLPLQGDYMIDKHHAAIYFKRMNYFLELLGNPQDGFKYIHIGGTSGKGTVTNMVHEILNAAGKKVGSFTSPYVTTSIEKIRVGNLYIHPDEFADIINYLKPFIDQAYSDGPYGRPSYFEICLAIAFIYFKRQNCEWVVLEVGLGGRFDATNVISQPLITAITNIDYDHTEVLGKTLKKIAYDKAGIIKPGCTFFTSERRSSLLRLFDEVCKDQNTSIIKIPSEKNYQKSNEALARAIAQYIEIQEKYIAQGITNSGLMCRFEIVQQNPIVILDGAHNRSKVRTTIYNLKKLTYKKLYLIVSISNNKDHLAILEQLVPLGNYIFFTRFQNKDRVCAHPKELLNKSKKYIKNETNLKINLDPEMALDSALVMAEETDVILVVGSFFLAGELRKRWFSEERIIENRSGFTFEH